MIIISKEEIEIKFLEEFQELALVQNKNNMGEEYPQVKIIKKTNNNLEIQLDTNNTFKIRA